MQNPLIKNLIDIFTALLMPTIAIFGIVLGFWQQRINHRKLKNELFNRRIKLFDIISHYISDILCTGNIEQGKEAQFLRNTRNAFFIFDKNIEKYIEKIYAQSIELQALCNLRNSLSGDKLNNAINKEKQIKDWFIKELNRIRPKFQKYLKL